MRQEKQRRGKERVHFNANRTHIQHKHTQTKVTSAFGQQRTSKHFRVKNINVSKPTATSSKFQCHHLNQCVPSGALGPMQSHPGVIRNENLAAQYTSHICPSRNTQRTSYRGKSIWNLHNHELRIPQ